MLSVDWIALAQYAIIIHGQTIQAIHNALSVLNAEFKIQNETTTTTAANIKIVYTHILIQLHFHSATMHFMYVVMCIFSPKLISKNQ